jgi:hypothetical protein
MGVREVRITTFAATARWYAVPNGGNADPFGVKCRLRGRQVEGCAGQAVAVGRRFVVPARGAGAFVRRRLNARWPDLDDLDEGSVDDSPWSDSPLIGNAGGPFVYFAAVYSRAAEVAAYAADRAEAHDLVLFDVNDDRLLT